MYVDPDEWQSPQLPTEKKRELWNAPEPPTEEWTDRLAHWADAKGGLWRKLIAIAASFFRAIRKNIRESIASTMLSVLIVAWAIICRKEIGTKGTTMLLVIAAFFLLPVWHFLYGFMRSYIENEWNTWTDKKADDLEEMAQDIAKPLQFGSVAIIIVAVTVMIFIVMGGAFR